MYIIRNGPVHFIKCLKKVSTIFCLYGLLLLHNLSAVSTTVDKLHYYIDHVGQLNLQRGLEIRVIHFSK